MDGLSIHADTAVDAGNRFGLGPMTVIAYLTDPALLGKILTHLGLPASPPPLAPAAASARWNCSTRSGHSPLSAMVEIVRALAREIARLDAPA